MAATLTAGNRNGTRTTPGAQGTESNKLPSKDCTDFDNYKTNLSVSNFSVTLVGTELLW